MSHDHDDDTGCRSCGRCGKIGGCTRFAVEAALAAELRARSTSPNDMENQHGASDDPDTDTAA